MKIFWFLFFLIVGMFVSNGIAQSNPQWVQEMYAPNPDPGKVKKSYQEYYQANPFVKNQHTQYYKRWMRSLGRTSQQKLLSPAEQEVLKQNRQNYVQKSKLLRQQKAPTSAWQSIGPWNFDIDAASRSYAPGAAHVYTAEQAASSPNTLYAGTSTAGLWKSTDYGLNWIPLTKDLLLNRIFAIEIDHQNADVVYFESGGDLYKTIDGGSNWQTIGNPSFQSMTHDAQDIVMDPVNNQILLLSSDEGLFRTTNGGVDWTQIETGEWQEIEFHPLGNDTVYAIKQVANRTEFYKSVDNGLTFVLKPTGWPTPPLGDDQD